MQSALSQRLICKPAFSEMKDLFTYLEVVWKQSGLEAERLVAKHVSRHSGSVLVIERPFASSLCFCFLSERGTFLFYFIAGAVSFALMLM